MQSRQRHPKIMQFSHISFPKSTCNLVNVFTQLARFEIPTTFLEPANANKTIGSSCSPHHCGVFVFLLACRPVAVASRPVRRASVISTLNHTSSHTSHHTHLISHITSHTQLISHNSSHTTHLTQLISHTTHLTQLISHNSSHTTHLTQLTSHNSSLTQLISHTTHLTQLISHPSSHTTHLSHNSSPSSHTPLISHTTHLTRRSTQSLLKKVRRAWSLCGRGSSLRGRRSTQRAS